jgi:ribosomal protein L37AE/L43A
MTGAAPSCPICGGQYSLSRHPQNGFYQCTRCEWVGRWEDLIQ